MTFLTPSQFFQLCSKKKCAMCKENAIWIDKLDENMPAYCDEHFPGRTCECEICKKYEVKDEYCTECKNEYVACVC